MKFTRTIAQCMPSNSNASIQCASLPTSSDNKSVLFPPLDKSECLVDKRSFIPIPTNQMVENYKNLNYRKATGTANTYVTPNTMSAQTQPSAKCQILAFKDIHPIS